MKLPFLITAGVGGDTLNTETESMFNDYLRRNGCSYKAIKGYGMTELCATGVTTFGEANALGSVGVPLAANTVKIVDMDTGEELGYDKTGKYGYPRLRPCLDITKAKGDRRDRGDRRKRKALGKDRRPRPHKHGWSCFPRGAYPQNIPDGL